MNFNSKVQKTLISFGSLIEAELEKSHIPGIATAIVFDQETIFAEGYGFADLEAKTPAISQTIFRIGSITKLFTAIAIMQLRDSSLLQLDDKISTYISLPSDFHTITMRQLMAHTSGLPRETPLDYMETLQFPSSEEIMNSLDEVSLLADPGTRYSYSNLGYALLAYIIEQITNRPYKQYVIDLILRPLGMYHSGYDLKDKHRSKAAIGYETKVPPVSAGDLDLDIGGFASAGQLYSSVADMARFIAWQFSEDSNVLAANSRREMFAPLMNINDEESTAMGWGFTQKNNHVFVSQNGRTFGYSADIILIPESKLGAVILANMGFDPEPLNHLTQAALESLYPLFNDYDI